MIGCSSSVRFSSAHGSMETPRTSGSMLVPPGWDYRASYRIPQRRLLAIADSYIGVHYRWGGMNRKGVDCSGLVCLVFGELCHAKMPRSAGDQYRLGRSVDRDQAQVGDLVFFRTGIFNTIGHVGIMVGPKRFVHASSSPKGVMYSNLDEDYYRNHFAGIRRLF
jgi:probable lipoprotein NlpC